MQPAMQVLAAGAKSGRQGDAAAGPGVPLLLPRYKPACAARTAPRVPCACCCSAGPGPCSAGLLRVPGCRQLPGRLQRKRTHLPASAHTLPTHLLVRSTELLLAAPGCPPELRWQPSNPRLALMPAADARASGRVTRRRRVHAQACTPCRHPWQWALSCMRAAHSSLFTAHPPTWP